MAHSDSQIKELEQKLDQLVSANRKLEKERKELKDDKDNLEREKSGLQSQLAVLHYATNKQSEELQSIRKELGDMREENGGLKNENKNLCKMGVIHKEFEEMKSSSSWLDLKILLGSYSGCGLWTVTLIGLAAIFMAANENKRR